VNEIENTEFDYTNEDFRKMRFIELGLYGIWELIQEEKEMKQFKASQGI